MPQVGTIDQKQPLANRVPGAVASASAQTGIDFKYLMNQARIESGMNPNARARTSSAAGLFQFTKQTWLATVKTHGAQYGLEWAADAISRSDDGRYQVDDPSLRQSVLDLRFQPEAASNMAAELASDNQNYLSDRLGSPPQEVDLYLAHFLGAAGAARFLEAHRANPDADAAALLPTAASANRNIFYDNEGQPRSLDAIRNQFAARLNSGGAVQMATYQSTASTLAALPTPLRIAQSSPEEFPPMQAFQPMPGRLSLDFARSAYRRLAGMHPGEGA